MKLHKPLQAVIAAVLVLACSACIQKTDTNTTKGLKNFNQELEERDFDEAYSLYNELSPEEMTNANRIIKEKVEEIVDRYLDSTYDYSSAFRAVQSYDVFGAGLTDSAKNVISTDNSFKVRLDDAYSFFNSAQYTEALWDLAQIDASSRYYSEAQELTEKSIAAYQDSIQSLCASFSSNHRYNDIFALLEEANTVLPDDTVLNNLITQYQLEEKEYNIDQLIQICESYATNHDYEHIYESIAQSAYSDENEVKELLYTYTEEERNYLIDLLEQNCKDYATKNDYPHVFEIIDASQYSNDPKVITFKNMYYTEWVNYTDEEAKRIGEGGDNRGAADYLDKTADQFKKWNQTWAESLETTFSVYYDRYVSETISQANEYAEAKDFVSASNLLDDLIRWGLNNSDSDKVKLLYDDYSKRCPTWLWECPCLENTLARYDITKPVSDAFGKKYENGISTMQNASSEQYAIYNSNGYFKYLSGTLFSTQGGTLSYSVSIYADDALLASYKDVKESDYPISFELDINYAKKIKIETSAEGDVYSGRYICFGEMKLYN